MLQKYVEDEDGYYVPELYSKQVFTCGWDGAWQPTEPVRNEDTVSQMIA